MNDQINFWTQKKKIEKKMGQIMKTDNNLCSQIQIFFLDMLQNYFKVFNTLVQHIK